MHSGEFSWASLNFAKGRLVVEAAAARPKPDIAAGTLHGIRAKCGGTVLRTNLTSGTMLVQPGQQVEAGQGLIGTARAERDGTLIFAPAAGTVVAQFEWSDTRTVPLEETVQQYTGACTRAYRVTAFGHTFSLPAAPAPEHAAVVLRHFQPEVPLLGLALPCSVEETCRYVQQPETLHRTEAQAAALARLQSLQALYAAWPDAEPYRPQRGLHRERQCTGLYRYLHRGSGHLRVMRKKGLPISGKALLHFASYLFSAACASYSASRSLRSYWYLLWQKWHTTSQAGSSSRILTSSLRPRLNSISLVRSALQSHW